MRKIISLLMLWVMLVLTYTGLMLFIVPEGKVAYWVNWSMFGMTKTQFGEMHISLMILFIVVTVIHLVYNWKAMMMYMKDKTKNFIFFTKENMIALGITIVFVVGTLFVVQPFKTVFDFQKDIKHYWSDELGKPPYGHAELSSLKKFCKRLDYDLKASMDALEEAGIKVENPKHNLKKIAGYNGITPAKIYDVIFDTLE